MSEGHIAKNFWRETFALASLDHARKCYERLTKMNYEDDPVVFNALWNSLIISYCRPFTDNSGVGTTSIKSIPPDRSIVHDALTTIYRNKMIGHLDPNLRGSDGRRFHEVLLHRDPLRVTAFPLRSIPETPMIEAAGKLIECVFKNVATLAQAHKNALPELNMIPPGEYIFDFEKPLGSRCTRIDANSIQGPF